MPSQLHEVLLLLFRNRPELAADLLRGALAIDLPAYTEARVESAEFSELNPAEYRADLVVVLASPEPVFSIVVEVQLGRDDRKGFSWPMYACGLRARLQCDVALLVVTPSSAVATWAARPVRIGPGNVFTPFVVGPNAVPIVTDPAAAEAEPELAVLSVMAHGDGDVDTAVRIATAATAGLRSVHDQDLLVLYSDTILTALSEAARRAFQMIPADYEVQSELVRHWVRKGRTEGLTEGRAEGLTEGRAEGLTEGRAEGLTEGRAEGLTEGRAEAVLTVLEARDLTVTPAQRQKILRERDGETVGRWLRAALTATSTDALFE